MLLKRLYKKSKNNKQQVWWIEVEENRFRTTEGYVDGQQTPTEWTSCEGKRQGSSNATTAEEQALKEAEAKIKKQLDKGWSEDINMQGIHKIEPMLAHKYNNHQEYVLARRGVASQPKLDGIRCVCEYGSGLFTRNGKSIVAAPHILEELQEFFTCIDIRRIGASIIIDGELYNHELKDDFNQITSIVRKQKVTEKDLEKSKTLLQYHIYDIDFGDDTNFTSRFATLDLPFTRRKWKYLRLVDTTFLPVAGSTGQLDRLYGEYREAGYEGQMIRIPGSPYQHCRTKDLLKRKEFMDEEFEITDIEEGRGNRSGMMGRVKFKMKNGKEFDSNARGTHEYFTELLINKDKYIGKMATVRFQNYTPDGNVRFPVMISIRNYE